MIWLIVVAFVAMVMFVLYVIILSFPTEQSIILKESKILFSKEKILSDLIGRSILCPEAVWKINQEDDNIISIGEIISPMTYDQTKSKIFVNIECKKKSFSSGCLAGIIAIVYDGDKIHEICSVNAALRKYY